MCCDDDGVPSRFRRHDASVFLYAFDLIELNGDDLRREPFETRKATLASLLKRAAPGLHLNEHIEGDGPTMFAHACKMGLEGILSKRRDSRYRSGRSPDWIKSKNPACEAVRGEAQMARCTIAFAKKLNASGHSRHDRPECRKRPRFVYRKQVLGRPDE